MAFTVTVNSRGIIGDIRYVEGKYVNDSGSTGGEVPTGLSLVKQFFIQEKGASTVANHSVVNETLPLSKGDVTIVTNADETGTFLAIGN